jgi:enamine deaminase RidA (YjgF/YER057c/UK114 family)
MQMAVHVDNPVTLPAPAGRYSHLSRVRAGELVFVAGQVPLDAGGDLVGKGDFSAQVEAVFDNLRLALESQGCGFADVARFTTYLVRMQDIAAFREVRTELFRKIYPDGGFPPNTLLVVDRLVSEDFLVEIEAIAAVPA